LKLAVFTLESLANARAVRRFIADHSGEIAFIGISNPYRKSAGGSIGQFLRHLRRSGWRFVPFLTLNFSLPGILAALRQYWPWTTSAETTPVVRLCRDYGIPTAIIHDLNTDETRATLLKSNAELIVSFHFDQIFDAETLATTRFGGINVHPSLLPHHRGPVPTWYAMQHQPPLFGVTIHRLVEKIDAGDILLQEQVALPRTISALGAAVALHEQGRVLLEAVLKDIDSQRERTVHPDLLPYCPFPTPAALKEAGRKGYALVRLADLWTVLRTAF
jgi:folate-dependent phosphoribosylglycinamide formyltransferase PurN